MAEPRAAISAFAFSTPRSFTVYEAMPKSGPVAADLGPSTRHRVRHQDHRTVSDLTWETFRHHLELEYEVPKYDGDLGSPNVFVPLTREQTRRKIEHLHTAFPSQHDRSAFDPTVLTRADATARARMRRPRRVRRGLLRAQGGARLTAPRLRRTGAVR
jgi:LmbE family N-acetylglucosaminyl deacetylase